MGLFPGNKQNVTPEAERPVSIPPAPGAHSNISSRTEMQISDDLMRKHEESRRKYPRIHLSRGEYVVVEVRRHPIGLLSIWITTILLVAGCLALIPFYGANVDTLASAFMLKASVMPTAADIAMPLIALAVLFGFGGLLAVYVYNGNLFYLTNESIIQYIQTSIFATQQQQINLVNIDDVSNQQSGVLQQVLNYGTLHVTTEGDGHSSYTFPFVANPQNITRMVNDAMEEATGFAVRYRHHNVEEEAPKHY